MIHDPQHTIIETSVTGPNGLRLRFADGEVFEVDLAAVIRTHPALAALSDPAVFAGARVDARGGYVVWVPDDLEIAAGNLRNIAAEGPVHRARGREGPDVLALMTVRSHDQFNTTVYGQDDRYRGIFGGRRVLFIHPDDLARRRLRDGDRVDIEGLAEDGVERRVTGFRAVAYDIPPGCVAAYFPESTPLMALSLAAAHTATPDYKEIPVLVRPTGR